MDFLSLPPPLGEPHTLTKTGTDCFNLNRHATTWQCHHCDIAQIYGLSRHEPTDSGRFCHQPEALGELMRKGVQFPNKTEEIQIKKYKSDRKKMTIKNILKAIDMLERGKKFREINDALGYGQSTISAYLRKGGLTLKGKKLLKGHTHADPKL